VKTQRKLAPALMKVFRKSVCNNSTARWTDLAEKRGVQPFVEGVGFFRSKNANSAFEVFVQEAGDENLGDFPLVGHESVVGLLGGAIWAIWAQDFDSCLDANDCHSIQETLQNSY
jgi:hypothetical protein